MLMRRSHFSSSLFFSFPKKKTNFQICLTDSSSFTRLSYHISFKRLRVWLLVPPTLPHEAHWHHKVTRNFLCESPAWVKAPPEMNWNVLNQPSPDKSILLLPVNHSSTSALVWEGLNGKQMCSTGTHICVWARWLYNNQFQSSESNVTFWGWLQIISGTKMGVQKKTGPVFFLMNGGIIDTPG